MVGALLATSPALPATLGLIYSGRMFVASSGTPAVTGDFMLEVRHPHVRDWIRRTDVPRMSSLLKSCSQPECSLIRFLTERIDSARSSRFGRFIWKAHYRVAGNVVEAALRAALRSTCPRRHCADCEPFGISVGRPAPIPISSPLQRNCKAEHELCARPSRPHPTKAPVPKDRIEEALVAELTKPDYTDLRSVAASVGLSSARRLYKGFHDLRLAISAKNAAIKKRRREAIDGRFGSGVE